MPRNRTSKNYTIQPFGIAPDQGEIDLLMINFCADNLRDAQVKAMLYANKDAFPKDAHGMKLLRNNAEVWRWLKGQEVEWQ